MDWLSPIRAVFDFALPLHRVVVSFWAGKAESSSPDIKLVARVDDRMYRKLKAGGQVQVRYATEDPRIMLIEGVEEMVF